MECCRDNAHVGRMPAESGTADSKGTMLLLPNTDSIITMSRTTERIDNATGKEGLPWANQPQDLGL